jgi:hypothetical protein
MELPASEIEFWRAYYSIFPFPQERADERTALLAQTISNMSGRTIKENYLLKLKDFLPHYVDDTASKRNTLEQQAEADKAFASKLMEMQAMAKGN